MKIIELIASNILRINAIHLIPKGDVNEIKGLNGAGKSSVLDLIVLGFKGKKGAPAEPVTHGKKKGEIKLTIDGDPDAGIPKFTITSKVTNDKIETIIEPASLLKGETPRSFLDKLLGHISFDPLEFMNKAEKDQRNTLAALVGVDIDQFDQDEKLAFDERTEKGRELKAAKIKVDALTCYPDVKQTEETNFAELSDKLQKAMKHNQGIKDREMANETLKNVALIVKNKEIPDCEKEIVRLLQLVEDEKVVLSALQSDLKVKVEQFKTEKEAISKLVSIDIEDINLDIFGIEETNKKIRANILHAAESKTLKSVQSAYDKLDAKVDSIREGRQKAIQSANLPIPNLSFGDDGLLYNSIPLKQCSDGEKLMVSMAISMALNPTLRVLRIKDGSLLDSNNLAILSKMVKDKGYQLFIERVQSKDEYDKLGKAGIYITEGVATGEGVVEPCDEPVPEPPKPATKPTGKPAPNPVTEPDW